MKKLRIRKIITTLIIITWVPSSFARPPSVVTPSAIVTPLSIVGIEGKNQLNLNFISGSNGQKLVILEHCQDGSCKPLGLKEGYSFEKISSGSYEQFRDLLETWRISSAARDEQLRKLLEALGTDIKLTMSLVAVTVSFAAVVGMATTVILFLAGVLKALVLGDLSPEEVRSALVELGKPGIDVIQQGFLTTQLESRRKVNGQGTTDSGRSLRMVIKENTIRKIVAEIEEALEEDSETLVPLPRD